MKNGSIAVAPRIPNRNNHAIARNGIGSFGFEAVTMIFKKWYVQIAPFLMVAVSFGGAVSGQDWLKQLETKLFQKQQESKSKDKPTTPEEPAKETEREPLRLPSVLEPEGLPAPGLLKPGQEIESQELPAPKAESKSPTVKKSTRPAPSTVESSASKASRGAPSPFSKLSPNSANTTQTVAGGGGFLGLDVAAIPGGGFGLAVLEVTRDSPAWKAGFRIGDKIIGVSGQAVSTVDAFAEQLARFAPGTPVKFLVDSRGKTATRIAVLQDRAIAGQIHGSIPGTAIDLDPSLSPIAGKRPGQAYFGVNVSDMSEAYRRQFGIPAYRGASVTEVVPNSPAHSVGLKPGDCIVEIEGTTVQSAEVVFDTISRSKPGQLISFSFYRGRNLTSASVPLVSNSDTNGRRPVSPEMLTPEYVAGLQGELERVHSELTETQARVQELEARLLSMENKR